MLMDPRPSQQHAGPLHTAALQLQQEVTRPMTRFEPTLLEKSGLERSPI